MDFVRFIPQLIFVALLFCSSVRVGDCEEGNKYGGPYIPIEPPRYGRPLSVLNITAVRVNQTIVQITWDTQWRMDKFCKIFTQGTDRKEMFTWTLQVLWWTDWTAVANNPSYEKNEHVTTQDHTYSTIVSLNENQCSNKSYLLTSLSTSNYYKFQIRVEKHKKDDNYAAKLIAQSGSYIHYFGNQTPPKITYPTSQSKICGPLDPNICKASGNPPPRTQLLKLVGNNDNFYECLSENTHIDNFGNKSSYYDTFGFYWNTTSCSF